MFLKSYFPICLCLLVSGCAKTEPKLYPVSGTVSFKNRPIVNAELTFHPQFEGPGWMPIAVTDEHGAFDISTKLPGDGALPGRYIVTVVWRTDIDEPESANQLPAHYASPKTSGLEVHVSPDTIHLPGLKLTGD